jgi:hypothetical protein
MTNDEEIAILRDFMDRVPSYVDFESALWGATTALLLAREVDA